MSFSAEVARALTERGEKHRERQVRREANKAIRVTERRIRKAAAKGDTTTTLPASLSDEAGKLVRGHFEGLGYRVYRERTWDDPLKIFGTAIVVDWEGKE